MVWRLENTKQNILRMARGVQRDGEMMILPRRMGALRTR